MKRLESYCSICRFRWAGYSSHGSCPNCLAPPTQVGAIVTHTFRTTVNGVDTDWSNEFRHPSKHEMDE